jgi:hypothetical protein
MPKKHRGAAHLVDQVDVQQLIAAQSFRDAVVAGLIVIILFSVLLAMLSTLIGKAIPLLTILLGVLIGLVIRRAGKGLGWRFPALAVLLTLLGSAVSTVVVGAAFSAEDLGVSTFDVLRGVTTMTWPVFLAEKVWATDVIYALFGAAVASYYANRRLSRSEYSALRRWREGQHAGED